VPSGWTFAVPRGRYRTECSQFVSRRAPLTFIGEGLDLDLPTFYRAFPQEWAQVTISRVDDLICRRLRFEGTNISRTAAGIWGAASGAIGQNIFRYIPANYAKPIREAEYGD